MKLKKGNPVFVIYFTIGYGMLVISDWKIAVGVFFIHWYMNIKVEESND